MMVYTGRVRFSILPLFINNNCVNDIIFLDIDGVLNNHKILKSSEYCGILSRCIDNLNIIIQYTGADLVISSAWRYIILGGEMTCLGFKYMLITHGLTPKVKILGTTVADDITINRESQIKNYLDSNKVNKFIILDDLNIFPSFPKNFYLVNPNSGLTRKDVSGIKKLWDKMA